MPAQDPVFIDTNVLVHVSRPDAPQHQRALHALARIESDGAPPWISLQVLREYLAVSTRPQASGPALSMAEALADVARLRVSFHVAVDRKEDFDRLLRLLETHPGSGKQVHDANLMASMLGHGVLRLLTFNEADFRRFGRLIEVVMP